MALALMVDGFQEMSEMLTAAVDTVAPDDLARRIRAVSPSPTGTSPRPIRPASRCSSASRTRVSEGNSERTSGPAAGATMASLERLVQTVVEHGQIPTPLVRDVGPTWAGEAGTTAQRSGGQRIPADAYQALLHFLAAVHGFACLENFDHLNWMSEQSRDDSSKHRSSCSLLRWARRHQRWRLTESTHSGRCHDRSSPGCAAAVGAAGPAAGATVVSGARPVRTQPRPTEARSIVRAATTLGG